MSMGWFKSLSDVHVLAIVASCPVTRCLDIYLFAMTRSSVSFEAGGQCVRSM